MPTGAIELIDLLSKGSPVLLAFVIVAFIFEWIVPGRVNKAEKEENKMLLLKVDALTDRLVEAVRLAGRATRAATRDKDNP